MGVRDLAGFRGTVVWRGEDTYERTRRAMLWNGWKPDRYPELIARATSTEDVVHAVRFAARGGLRVAVRGGGHSWCGSPVRDGMLLDLSGLGGIAVDASARTASIRPATSNRELAATLTAHGLSFPVGHGGDVPASGYLLAGGIGWNSRVLGPACRSVREVEVVTADGEVVRANSRENPGLFWAARGAGPGFPGAMTRFEIELHPLPAAMTATTHVYALADLDVVADFAAELCPRLPARVEPSVLLAPSPEGVAPQPEGRVVILSATAFTDTAGDAAADLAPLESCPAAGRALLRRSGIPTSFAVLHGGSGLWPEGHRYAADTAWSGADLREVLSRCHKAVSTAPSSGSLVLVTPDPLPDDAATAPDMAFSMRDRVLVSCYAIWQGAVGDKSNNAWLRAAMAELEPATTGHYVAEADLPAAPSRAARSFSEPCWRRIEELRARVDPGGVFHTFLGHG
ncbi:FAD/FMN-containing dehydrogenase [Saccharopolyspora erythraea NRRL 2338]|uniref:FAD linked oxidase-like n=2 Tax=Saccharopolyspora erythraea TaxID=1836 RepID=A4FMJ0_SACEN|nr:FAD-binding oxidoreductase [Saccharopolyspora erythraea]EQD85552.1 FAD-binding protein [Saccharopolyspora erythraea D]PFG98913.1 FAD/FMN-containing dehydrogenase [Saccharopolyspora erythraea NRRL 2338]QRK88899.1 FAD-binding oxidoreductase [Saccharopolyspora erythraea]CAM05265.1 FAD linked oxidase-like [Saccharopolyspora erythraea NRRL 2338]